MNNKPTPESSPHSSPLMPSPPPGTVPPPVVTTAILNGKAWVFGDDINTDIIIPFRFKSRTNDPNEMAKYAMYGIDPDFHKKIDKGDILVAGRNFGGGSSREQAPLALQYAGISAIVAESFARIFYRNAVDGGYLLPIEVEESTMKRIDDKDELEIDVSQNKITNMTKNNESYGMKPFPELIARIVEAGGLMNFKYGTEEGKTRRNI